MPCLIILGILGALFLLLFTCSAEQPSSPTPSQLAMSKEEAMATLINLKGHLCAKVILVTPELSSGEKQVNCEEYRDRRKARTKNNMIIYMVNLDRGSVRLMGRG